MESYFLVGAVLVAVAGAACDARSRRIPNWLTYRGLMAAVLVRFALAGWMGLKSGLESMLLAGGIFLVLFLLGGMGGGDVKLMASVAAWAGIGQVVAILLASAIAGGALAIAYMIAGRRVRRTLLNSMQLAGHHLTSGLQPHPTLNIREQDTMRAPFGVAIGMGTVFCACNALWWR